MGGICATCGRANDDDAGFCQGCGAALVGPTGRDAAPEPAAPPRPPAPTRGTVPSAGGPPRRGKRAPWWLVTLISVATIALASVLVFVLVPRGDGTVDGQKPPAPSAGATVGASPMPSLDHYLAGAVGPKADQLAAISGDGTVRPITRFRGAQIRQIGYSPNGKWLACIAGTYKRSELWLFSAATGDARQATAEAPDIAAVDSIAWLSEDQLLVAGHTKTPEATGRNAEMLVYDVAARRFSPLLDAAGLALRGLCVSASRDGARVAFVTYTDRKTDKYGMATAQERLELLDRATGSVTQLGAHRAQFDVNARAFDEPLISPNGKAIIYRRAGSDVGTSYTVIAADGSTLMPPRETQCPAGYAWDPAGTKVVFTGHSLKPAAAEGGMGPAIFWVYDIEADSTQELARYPDTMVQELSWSPDGASIAWAEYDQEKHHTGTICVLPATGGDSTTLVEGALSPAWAPGAAESLQTSPSQ
jgi:Tol biopolymer transport system component